MRRSLLAGVIAALGLALSVFTTGISRGDEALDGVPIMPGGGVVDGTIVYDGGDVIVVPANEVEGFDSCPTGYVCLFANTSWQGTMVQFRSCCAWSNLSSYGFNDMASSWRNRLSVDAQLAKDANGGGATLCLNNGGYASSMPSGWDNSASSIRVRDGAGYC
jgi:hypothetical protein